MKAVTIYFLFFFSIINVSFSQSHINSFLKPSDSLHTSRKNTVLITEGSLTVLSLLALNQLWYADFDRSKFRTVNDSDEWLQMDKLGHVYSSYQMSRLGAESMNWAGVDEKGQLIYSAALSLTFLTTVEVFDGFSKEWGFSWSDIAANFAGTGLYVGQELLWNEQRITPKFSFHRTKYAKQRPDKLGENFLEEILKDYNGETQWYSVNLHSFFKESKLPKWLNIAVGYGAEGMLTGRNEPENMLFEPQDRYRQYYLSLDIDLSRIKTNSNVLKTVFSLLNTLKVPFPTLEFNSKNKLVFHLLYY